MANLISFLKIPDEIETFDDLPDGFEPEIIGTVDKVLEMVQEFYPYLTESDLIIAETPVRSFALRNPILEVIQTLYEEYDLRAVDPSQARIMPPFDE